METFKAIYGRRSVREFAPGKKIPEDVVRRIIEAASYAPSVPLTPPVPPPPFMWRIIVVRGEEARNLVADAALEATRLLFGSSFETIGAGHYWYMHTDNRLRVAEYTTSGELWEYPRDADIMFVPAFSNGGWIDTISTFTPDLEIVAHLIGFPQQNMWLVAHKYGIGAGYNAVPFADVRRREVLSEPLGIPLSWSACGGFCFSYPKMPRWFGPSRPSPRRCWPGSARKPTASSPAWPAPSPPNGPGLTMTLTTCATTTARGR